MKKILSLLLLSGLLITFISCAKSSPDNTSTTTSTADGTTEPEPSDDTLLTSEEYSFDLSKHVTLPALADLGLKTADLQKNVDALLMEIRQYNAIYEEADADYAAVSGDQVNIHYKGYAANAEDNISEETLANMTNMQYDDDGTLLDGDDLVLGSNSFIGAYESEEHPENNNPGFEDQLVGMKAGETRTITVTFPDTYGNSEELRGKVVKFDVTVNKVNKGTIPELTDEMVADYTSEEYTTIEGVTEYLQNYYKGGMVYDAIMAAAVAKDHPTDLLDDAIAQYVADYIEYTYYGEELTDEETKVIFDEQYEDASAYAIESVGTRMILEALFKEYSISLTYGEYKVSRAALFEQDYFALSMYYGITTEEAFEEYVGRDYLVVQFKYEKLLEVLAEQAVFE